MGMPTFDWSNIFSALKSVAVRTVTSRVGVLVLIAGTVGASAAGIASYFTAVNLPWVETSSVAEDVQGFINLDEAGFSAIASYCLRTDLIFEFLKWWVTFSVGVFTFGLSTLVSFMFFIFTMKIKDALRSDINGE